MRLFITNIILFLLLHAAVFAQTPRAEWTEGAADSSGHTLHTLVLYNVTKGSRVWFQELFDGKTYIEGPAMHHLSGHFLVHRHPEKRQGHVEILR